MSSAIDRSSTQVQGNVAGSARNTSKIRPTLFIALGGMGMEIALRVRRRILTHAWGSSDVTAIAGDSSISIRQWPAGRSM